MRLVELEPQFIRAREQDNRGIALVHVDDLANAQGIRFDCPKGEGHWVVVWFAERGVPAHQSPDWNVSGTGYDDLTLSPSVDCTGDGGCKWHGFVTLGEIT